MYPVFVDCYQRNLTWGELALPFPSLIDWSRLVVVMPYRASGTRMVRMLLDISDTELAARQAYMRHVLHWLTYDEPERYGGADAPAALIHELELRFSGSSKQ